MGGWCSENYRGSTCAEQEGDDQVVDCDGVDRGFFGPASRVELFMRQPLVQA